MSSDQIDLDQVRVRREVNEAALVAVAFLARCSGRTLAAYRQDLRFFAWTASVGLEVGAATRPHIELFRHHMEQRGLAASTIDRRLATVCGLYRFALDAGVPLCDVQLAARHADPRTTTIYDRRRENFDRHAAYVVVAFVAVA